MRCPATRGATVATPCSLRGQLDADPRAPAPSHVSRVPWAGTCPLQARVHTGHVCCSHVTTGRVTALLRPALSGGGRGGWPGQVDWYRCPTWCTGYTVIMGLYPTWYSGYIHYYYRTPNMVQWCLLVFSGLCLHSKVTYVRLIGLRSQPKTNTLV